MVADESTITDAPSGERDGLDRREAPVPGLALVILWSRADPGHVGHVAIVPADGIARVLGRGAAGGVEPEPRLSFGAQRPGGRFAAAALTGQRLSRRQLLVAATDGDELSVTAVGRCPLEMRGGVVDHATLRCGDTVHLRGELLLGVTRRLSWQPPLANLEEPRWPAFGAPDLAGMVAESPAAWRLRDELAFAARRTAHVLLLGESGAGKELAARAIHALSERGRRLVARSAATFPEGLIDAELFGNARNYPNPGMAERAGLIGEADGGTLFLDEVGELPVPLQARLLRVLDAGDYQRLGEARARQADIRLVAATNRDPDELKHDLLARLALRVHVPGLNGRAEDVALLVRHLLENELAADEPLAQRFGYRDAAGVLRARVDPLLVERLVAHHYTHHVRELRYLLLRAMKASRGTMIGMDDELDDELTNAAPADVAPETLDPAVIQACLDRNGGNQQRAWRELGLSSRFVLYRLVRKHGLRTSGDA